jgi:predicted RNase H-like HicB family nuclease
MGLVLHVELEKESDSRWIADVTNIPGVLVYGTTPIEAFRSAQALALEVIADRLKHGEDPLAGQATPSVEPLPSIDFL